MTKSTANANKANKLFLHGLGQKAESWNAVRAAGGCVIPDLYSLMKGQNSDYPHLYQSVVNLCSRIEGSLQICGLSLGAVLALQLAAEHPEKVDALILIAPQYKMPVWLLKIQNMLFHLMPDSAFEQTGLKKKEMIQLCRSMQKLDFTSLLPSVHCPVLILYGEKDRANRKAAKKLVQILSQAELKEIAGAGHEVNIEAPVRLSEELEWFAARIQNHQAEEQSVCK